jgi:hypothetical protein
MNALCAHVSTNWIIHVNIVRRAFIKPRFENKSSYVPNKAGFHSNPIYLRRKNNQFQKRSGFNQQEKWTNSRIISLGNVSYQRQKALNFIQFK